MKSAIEIAKEVLAWPCDAQNDVPQIVPLAEAVVSLSAALERHHKSWEEQSQALKEAENKMRTYIFRFDQSDGGMPENYAQLIEFKEWLAKYGEKK